MKPATEPSPWRPIRLGPWGYLSLASVCGGLLGYALWLQTQGYPPCPLCILARLAFLGIAGGCLLAALWPQRPFLGHLIASLSGLAGLAVSLRHQWVLAHPSASCGIDPLERWINQWAITRWWPAMFEAQGACSMPLAPVFGLQVPAWSLLWTAGLTAILLLGFKSALPIARR